MKEDDPSQEAIDLEINELDTKQMDSDQRVIPDCSPASSPDCDTNS